MVDGARVIKRMRPAPQGRGYRVRKRSNHVTLVVDIAGGSAKAPKAEAAAVEEPVAEKKTAAKKTTTKTAAPKKAATKKDSSKK